MNHSRHYHYVQHVYHTIHNFTYGRLLYQIVLVCIGLFGVISLLKQNGLQQANYLSAIDIMVLIIIPFIMAELIVRRHNYPNKRWNNMILLASFIIGLSSLTVFY